MQAITGYFQHDMKNKIEPWPFPVTGADGVSNLLPFNIHEKYQNFSQELRIISPENRPVTFLAGAYFSTGKLTSDEYYGYYFLPFGAFFGPPFTASDLVGEHDTFYQRDNVKSVFAAATAHIGNNLRINGGLRYSVVHKTALRGDTVGLASSGGFVTADNFVPVAPSLQDFTHLVLGTSGDQFTDPNRTDKKLMPSVSVQYDLAHGVMTYASFAKGFKAGGFSDGSIANPFGPENVNSYEIGMKGTFLDRRLTLNLAAFWSDFTGLQETSNITLPDGTDLNYVANAGKARSRGIELESTARLTNRLRFQTSLGYLESTYTYFPDGPCTVAQSNATPNCAQNLTGKPRPYAPKWSGIAGLSYALPLGNGVVSIDPSVRFSSGFEQQVNNDPLLAQSGYAKADLRIAYAPTGARWDIAVIGSNLTDKITASFRNTASSAVYALPEPGRSVLVQLSVRR